jgi:septal ring factor EnvC (AmiA/AmiB activator)
MRIFVVCSLFFILFFSPEVNSEINYDKKLNKVRGQIKDNREDLDEIQNQIQKRKKDKNKVEKEEQNITGEIKSLNKDLSGVGKELIQLKEHLLMTKDKIRTINEELKSVQKEKKEHLKILKKELYFIYVEKLWDVSEYDFWAKGLVLSKPIAELIKKYEFLKSVTRKRLNTFEEAKKNEQLIVELKGELISEKKKSEIIRQKTKQKETIFLTNKKKKTILRKKLHSKKIIYEKEIKKLKESARALQNLVNVLNKQTKVLEGEKEKGLLMAQRKGFLAWPRAGRVVSLFGKRKHPRLDSYVINNGIKIKSETSTEVKSVAPGKIMFADVFQMYGKMIIIDHSGGFYTVYGYLSRLNVVIGKEVKGGEIIGKVKTGRSLYFEVRENGKPQNPLNWLREKS